MRFRRPRGWRLFHFCGWDRQCRELRCSWYLHVNFLSGGDGLPLRFDLTPPRVQRRYDVWVDEVWALNEPEDPETRKDPK